MSELMRNQVELLVQQLWDLNDQASGDALLDHDAAQRLTIDRLERELERAKALSWNDNVQFLYESKEHLLQSFCNLQVTYGEQKHEIRDLTVKLAAVTARLGTCLWTETKDGHWETGCNQMHCFEDGSPSDNHLQYCGYCGERLTEQRWT